MSDDTATPEVHPRIEVLRGNPTDTEVAALVSVLAAAAGGAQQGAAADQDLWGHPVDALRYHTASWQRVTLVERLHMRR